MAISTEKRMEDDKGFRLQLIFVPVNAVILLLLLTLFGNGSPAQMKSRITASSLQTRFTRNATFLVEKTQNSIHKPKESQTVEKDSVFKFFGGVSHDPPNMIPKMSSYFDTKGSGSSFKLTSLDLIKGKKPTEEKESENDPLQSSTSQVKSQWEYPSMYIGSPMLENVLFPSSSYNALNQGSPEIPKNPYSWTIQESYSPTPSKIPSTQYQPQLLGHQLLQSYLSPSADHPVNIYHHNSQLSSGHPPSFIFQPPQKYFSGEQSNQDSFNTQPNNMVSFGNVQSQAFDSTDLARLIAPQTDVSNSEHSEVQQQKAQEKDESNPSISIRSSFQPILPFHFTSTSSAVFLTDPHQQKHHTVLQNAEFMVDQQLQQLIFTTMKILTDPKYEHAGYPKIEFPSHGQNSADSNFESDQTKFKSGVSYLPFGNHQQRDSVQQSSAHSQEHHPINHNSQYSNVVQSISIPLSFNHELPQTHHSVLNEQFSVQPQTNLMTNVKNLPQEQISNKHQSVGNIVQILPQVHETVQPEQTHSLSSGYQILDQEPRYSPAPYGHQFSLPQTQKNAESQEQQFYSSLNSFIQQHVSALDLESLQPTSSNQKHSFQRPKLHSISLPHEHTSKHQNMQPFSSNFLHSTPNQQLQQAPPTPQYFPYEKQLQPPVPALQPHSIRIHHLQRVAPGQQYFQHQQKSQQFSTTPQPNSYLQYLKPVSPSNQQHTPHHQYYSIQEQLHSVSPSQQHSDYNSPQQKQLNLFSPTLQHLSHKKELQFHPSIEEFASQQQISPQFSTITF